MSASLGVVATPTSAVLDGNPALHVAVVSGHVSVSAVGADRWAEGVEVVRAAHTVTGFPLNVATADLESYVAGRQQRAMSVWLAQVGGSAPIAIGHGLLSAVPADHPGWLEVPDPYVRELLTAGRLVELGGLAVRPGWTRGGVAEELVLAAVGLVACSAVWRDSRGSRRLAERYGRKVFDRTDTPSMRYLYC
jgi:hypothetical protein